MTRLAIRVLPAFPTREGEIIAALNVLDTSLRSVEMTAARAEGVHEVDVPGMGPYLVSCRVPDGREFRQHVAGGRRSDIVFDTRFEGDLSEVHTFPRVTVSPLDDASFQVRIEGDEWSVASTVPDYRMLEVIRLPEGSGPQWSPRLRAGSATTLLGYLRLGDFRSAKVVAEHMAAEDTLDDLSLGYYYVRQREAHEAGQRIQRIFDTHGESLDAHIMRTAIHLRLRHAAVEQHIVELARRSLTSLPVLTEGFPLLVQCLQWASLPTATDDGLSAAANSALAQVMPRIASTLPSLLSVHVGSPEQVTPEHRQPQRELSLVPLEHMPLQQGWRLTTNSLVRWGLPTAERKRASAGAQDPPADELPLQWSTVPSLSARKSHDTDRAVPSTPHQTETRHVMDPSATPSRPEPIGARHGGHLLFWTDLRPGADLSGATMSGADLKWVDLRRANLARSDLSGTSFYQADLARVDLTEADLSYARLIWMDLIHANLTGADLTRTNASWTNLANAQLTGANLVEANLTGSTLYQANLTGADLSGADLTGADLHLANLTEAKLTGANLTRTKLSWSDLTGANLVGTLLFREGTASWGDVAAAALMGVRWSMTTVWPDAATAEAVSRNSRRLPDGRHEVVDDGRIREHQAEAQPV